MWFPEGRLSLSSMHERWHGRRPVYDPPIGFLCAKERRWKRAWRGVQGSSSTSTFSGLRLTLMVALKSLNAKANHVMARDAVETLENVCGYRLHTEFDGTLPPIRYQRHPRERNWLSVCKSFVPKLCEYYILHNRDIRLLSRWNSSYNSPYSIRVSFCNMNFGW